jgi:N-acetylglucosaminylphosphatidylinositol deacetylase
MAAAAPAGEAEKPTSRFWMRRLNQNVARYLNRIPRRAWRWIIRLAVLAFILPIVLQWLIAYIVGGDIRLLPAELQAAQSVLVVTAHPDDECLFFSPTILRVLSGNLKTRGSLLSISNGELSL